MEQVDLARNAQAEAWLNRILGGNTSNAAITITGSGVVAFVVGLIASLGLVVSVACVQIVQAERRADMEQINSLRDEVKALREKTELNGVYIERLNRITQPGAKP